jgi:hypothetical protein
MNSDGSEPENLTANHSRDYVPDWWMPGSTPASKSKTTASSLSTIRCRSIARITALGAHMQPDSIALTVPITIKLTPNGVPTA